MSNLIARLGLLVVIASATACASSPSPSSSSLPSAAPVVVGPVTTEDQALAAVVATEPRLAGIGPKRMDVIGQSAWWEARPASGVGVYVVMVRIGWGDCEAGCIDAHSWTYAVGPDGEVRVVSEAGSPVPDDAWPTPINTTVTPITVGRTGVGGIAVAGPVCPVETNPPDPACAPRPVAGATVIGRDSTGVEVARTVTEADGSFFIALPPGTYLLEPQPVDGLLGTADSQTGVVTDGHTTTINLDYDTGIR